MKRARVPTPPLPLQSGRGWRGPYLQKRGVNLHPVLSLWVPKEGFPCPPTLGCATSSPMPPRPCVDDRPFASEAMR